MSPPNSITSQVRGRGRGGRGETKHGRKDLEVSEERRKDNIRKKEERNKEKLIESLIIIIFKKRRNKYNIKNHINVKKKKVQ